MTKLMFVFPRIAKAPKNLALAQLFSLSSSGFTMALPLHQCSILIFRLSGRRGGALSLSKCRFYPEFGGHSRQKNTLLIKANEVHHFSNLFW